jgi:hypothetical protein
MAGLALLAFGAVGGIAHGVTLGERFNCSHWRKPPSGRSFAQHRRIYVPDLDLMLSPKEAQQITEFSTRARSVFGCRDTACCPRGVKDMLEHPGRHFLCQRSREVASLSQIPEQLRPPRFLEQRLRPATDIALRATNINWADDAVARKMRGLP